MKLITDKEHMMTEKRTEMQGHNHKARTWKVLNGEQLVILEPNCKRCAEIKAKRDEKETTRRAFARHHRNPQVNEVLQSLAANGWTITPNKEPVTFLTVRCKNSKDRKQVRITTAKGSKAWDQLRTFLRKHEQVHPGEWPAYKVHFPS